MIKFTGSRTCIAGLTRSTGLLLILGLLSSCQSDPTPSNAGTERPDVILIVIDTLRADRLGCYGNPRALTPSIDALAAEGTLFERAVSAAPWTQPSVASLFCSFYPGVHKVVDYRQAFTATYEDAEKVVVFDDRFETLAEQLRDAGYQTAAFVANPYLQAEYGFAQGFEHFDASFAENHTLGSVVNEAALRWLDDRNDTRPVFLYLHYMDPHGPYDADLEYLTPLLDQIEHSADLQQLSNEELSRLGYLGRTLPREYESDKERHERLAVFQEYWEARYEAGVAQADAHVGSLRAELQSRGRWEQSLVVITSDHGEALCEHGVWDHGLSVHETDVHVPWVMKWADHIHAGQRIESVTRLIDLMPTVLDLLELALPNQLQGASLKSALESGAMREAPPALAEAVKLGPEQKSISAGEWKLVLTPSAGTQALYNLTEDPGEEEDLALLHPERAASLAQLLHAQLVRNAELAGSFVPGTTDVSPEQLERLRSLGYVK